MSRESEVVNLLTERTNRGSQKWEPTAEPGEFATVVGEVSITICALPDREEPASPNYLITVKDSRGNAVLEILNHAEGVTYKQLKDLFERARRQALNLDKTLDALIDQLKKEK
jgi:hypothetical protein